MRKACFRMFSAVMTAFIITSSLSANSFAAEFEDLENHWVKEEAESLINMGILSGVTPTSFEPDSTVTRGMLAVVVCNVLGVDPGDRVAFFRDVDNNMYYGAAIAWTYENNILSGYGDMTFRADDAVTREEMFCVLERVLRFEYKSHLASSDYELAYADKENISDYAVEPIKYLSEMGFINGDRYNMINPLRNATRAEMSSFIAKIMGSLNKQYVQDSEEGEADEVLTNSLQEMISEYTTEVSTEISTESISEESIIDDSTEIAREVIVEETEETAAEETTVKETTKTAAEETTESQIREENSPGVLLRNSNCVAAVFKNSEDREALRLVYVKRGTEYSCYVDIAGGSELYINTDKKYIFEKSRTGRLYVHVDALDVYDDIYGDILNNDINNIDFLEGYIDGIDIEPEAEISFMSKFSFPGFVAKLRDLTVNKTRNVKITDGGATREFAVAKDAVISVIGGGELFVDQQCSKAYNFLDFVNYDQTELLLYVKRN